MNSDNPTLEEERDGLVLRIRELDQMRSELPQLRELADQKEILKRQQEYLASLGFFHRSDRKRMEEQIREKKQQIMELEIELENAQHTIEDEIIDLNLAKQAIETEMERRS